MKRRRFLSTLGGAGVGLGLGAGSNTSLGHFGAMEEGRRADHPGAGFQRPFQKWVWVHGGGDTTSTEWLTRFGILKGQGFSGVLVGGGETAVIADAAHSSDLEFHRWIWTLNRNGDSWVRENHPEWFTVSRKLESSLTHPPYVDYYRWLCPTRPAVREYLLESILGTARSADVDGIHLDYVRHCDVILPRGLWSKYDLIQDREYPEFDFCYCNSCREAFSSQTGTDPFDLPDPTADPAWRRFRWDSVTELVRVLADGVHAVTSQGTGSLLRRGSSGKPISAAVFPTPTIARRLVRQAWDEWPLDAFFPMLYHEFYQEGAEWIGAGIREGLEALDADVAGPGGVEDSERVAPEPGEGSPHAPRLFAGLYLPTLNRDGTLQEAVHVARQAGAHGVSFFEMNGLPFLKTL